MVYMVADLPEESVEVGEFIASSQVYYAITEPIDAVWLMLLFSLPTHRQNEWGMQTLFTVRLGLRNDPGVCPPIRQMLNSSPMPDDVPDNNAFGGCSSPSKLDTRAGRRDQV